MIQLDPTSPYPNVAGDGEHHLHEQDHRHRACSGPSLNASDIYGNPKTIYPTGLPNLFLQTRGIDYTHADMLSDFVQRQNADIAVAGKLRHLRPDSRVYRRFRRSGTGIVVHLVDDWLGFGGADLSEPFASRVYFAPTKAGGASICEIWEEFAGRGLDGNCTSAYRAWRVLAMPEGYGRMVGCLIGPMTETEIHPAQLVRPVCRAPAGSGQRTLI